MNVYDEAELEALRAFVSAFRVVFDGQHEVRRVPPGWEPPLNRNGNPIPLKKSYAVDIAAYEKGPEQWEKGFVTDCKGGWRVRAADDGDCYEMWLPCLGPYPALEDYMPEWSTAEATHYIMFHPVYNTPLSPVFASPEELACWLADSKVPACGYLTVEFHVWLKLITEGPGIGELSEKFDLEKFGKVVWT